MKSLRRQHQNILTRLLCLALLYFMCPCNACTNCLQIEWFNGAKDVLMHEIRLIHFFVCFVRQIETIKFLHFKVINKNKFNDKVFEILRSLCSPQCVRVLEILIVCAFDNSVSFFCVKLNCSLLYFKNKSHKIHLASTWIATLFIFVLFPFQK